MKKRLALLLAVIMLFTSCVTVNAKYFTDTVGKSCETAVYVLSSLGILEGKEDGKFEPESPLTRAEMVTILLRATDLPSTAGRAIFSDVKDSHWAYDNISTAYDMKLVNGISETEFAPDEEVTYTQAVKMVVALLGYSVQAEAEGAYPAGYLAKGTQLNITKGVSQENFNRGEMAKLIFNALEVEMFVKTSYGENAYEYGTNGQTLLSTYLKAYKEENVYVAATPMAEIDTPSRELLSDEVYAGGKIYKQGNTDLQAMLGVKTDIYYRINDDTDALDVLAAVKSPSSEITEVKGDKVLSATSDTLFVYEKEDGKEAKINIAGAKLVFNGKRKTLQAADLKPAIGNIRLISNGGRAAETIIVESYVNAIAEDINPDKHLIYFQDGIDIDGAVNQTSISLDPLVSDAVIYDANGRIISVNDILKWDILSIIKNGDIIKIYRSYDSVEGTLSEKYDNEKLVTIDGEKYPVVAPLAMSDLSLGMKAQFYLDFLGNIVAVDEKAVGGKTYGWLVNAAVEDGLGAEPQFKIFTQNGDMKVYDMNSRLTLIQNGISSGKTKKEMKDIINGTIPSDLYKNGAIVAQLITFEANDNENVLNSITLAKNSTNEKEEYKFTDDVFSMDYYIYKGYDSNGLREWNGTKDGSLITTPGMSRDSGLFIGSTLMAKIGIRDTMPMFTIPKNVSNDSQYSVAPMKTRLNYDSYQNAQYISLYDISEEQLCGAAVQHNYITGTSQGGSDLKDAEYIDHKVAIAAVVKKVAVAVDSEGEESTVLTVYNKNGQEVRLIAPKNLQIGYIYANANFKKDPAWYTSAYNGNSQSARNSAIDMAIGNNSGRRTTAMKDNNGDPISMNILPGDIEPGDVIRYTAGAGNEIESAYVLSRVNYMSGGTFLYTPSSRWTPTPTTLYSGGGGVLLNGTVYDRNECGILVDTSLVDDAGKPNGTEVRYLIPTAGQCVLWNNELGTLQTITTADIKADDIVFSVWETNYQVLIVVYRDSKGIQEDWNN